MGILKKITDFIYGTQRVKRKYLSEHPDEKVFAADASKGILTKGESGIIRGFDWVTSQRAVVLLTDKRIKCGKWDISIDKIADAKLVKINSTFGSGQVLKIHTTDDDNFQFGTQMNHEWTTQKVLPLTFEKGKLKYSLFSIIIRIILLAYVIYWIIEKLK